jgi:queuosine precursor transporter
MNETSQRKPFKYFEIIMSLFVTVLVVSNIASSAKIVDWGFSFIGIRMAFDAGTILFPVSYIFGDILTEVYGYKKSRKVIWTGFLCLGISSVIFWIIKILPGEVTWEGYAGDSAYNAILGGMSSGGIVIASLLGYLCGEFTNSFTLAKLKIYTKGHFLWVRTIGSTIVGELVDTFIFVIVAIYFGIFPISLLVTLVLSNYVFKCGIEALMTPVTYAVVTGLKRLEQEDYYDYGTNFNPFTLKEN